MGQGNPQILKFFNIRVSDVLGNMSCQLIDHYRLTLDSAIVLNSIDSKVLIAPNPNTAVLIQSDHVFIDPEWHFGMPQELIEPV